MVLGVVSGIVCPGGELQITVLATGFEDGSNRRGRPLSTAR